jgi:putative transposase
MFVTFRLAGSLPYSVIAELRAEHQRQKVASSRITDPDEQLKQVDLDARHSFGRWDYALDNTDYGPRWLAEEQVATVVAQALYYRDQRVYDLYAFCIMPNHVHIVCTPLPDQDGMYPSLFRILQSLKRYTARQANEVLGRQGSFWQAESYDHVVRDEEELTRIVEYVRHNPVKAVLVASWERWPWTCVRE